LRMEQLLLSNDPIIKKMRKHNDQTIKDVLHQWVNSLKYKNKYNQSRIKMLWAELMGGSIAGYTQDIQLIRGKLYLTINSAVLKQDLSYGKEKIKKMLNDELGEECVQEVIIR